MSDITRLLCVVGSGDNSASEELLNLLYDDLRRHAAYRMSAEREQVTLQPTALVHEAWMRLTHRGVQAWQNRAHFFGAASEAMRRILIDRARRRTALKRGAHAEHVDLEAVQVEERQPDEIALRLDEALQKLAAEDPLKAQVVTLKFYGGRSNSEVAEMLQLSERSVERYWAYAKIWLFEAVQGTS